MSSRRMPALLIVLVLLVAACSGDEESTPTTADAPATTTADAPATTTTTTSPVSTTTTTQAPRDGFVVSVPSDCGGCDQLIDELAARLGGLVAVTVIETDGRVTVSLVSAGSEVASWVGDENTVAPQDRADVANVETMIVTACNVFDCPVDATTTTTQRPDEHYSPNVCRLANFNLADGVAPAYPDTAIGFPAPGDRLRWGLLDRVDSTGEVKTTVLFVDFEDVRATVAPEELFAKISPMAEDFYATVSYGALDLTLDPHFDWIHLGGTQYDWVKAAYGDIESYLEPGQNPADFRAFYYQTIVDLVDADYDFSETDSLLIVHSPEIDEFTFIAGPAWNSTRNFNNELGAGRGVAADGTVIVNAVFSGGTELDTNYLGGLPGNAADPHHFLWFAHEFGHNLGLVDLYSRLGGGFGSEFDRPYTGVFSLMNNISSIAPEHTAWERFRLDWLNDSQVVCQKHETDLTHTLTAIETPEGLKTVMVPLSKSFEETELVFVESRRAIGYDDQLTREGVVVYKIDTERVGVPPGGLQVDDGPVLWNVNDGGLPLQVGESLTVDGITITVLESDELTDTIQVITPAEQ